MALKLLTFTLPFGQSWPSRPSRVNEWAGPMDFTSVVVKSIKRLQVSRVLEREKKESAGFWKKIKGRQGVGFYWWFWR